ncbi:MAG TPA: Ku protein [Longimicrobiaceae bacterium]|nr:Ku protein [Longimicrobiaceae bacterium]
MAARAIWKGRIKFGSVDVPVKLYSAVQDRTVHFRLLDSKRKEPVKQKMVEPESGKVVEHSDIQRAYQTDDGEMVILDEDELEELEPTPSRDIEITRFVPPEQITHQWYDRPYYLGPDDSENGYFALVEALRNKEMEGVARWVMRNKEYVGALRVEGDYLMLITLRHAGEVIPASALTAPGGRDLSQKELKMAMQLVEALEDDLDFAAYKDEYRERVLELVEAKAEGKVIKFPKAPKKKTEKSLAAELEKSLAAAKKVKKSA